MTKKKRKGELKYIKLCTYLLFHGPNQPCLQYLVEILSSDPNRRRGHRYVHIVEGRNFCAWSQVIALIPRAIRNTLLFFLVIGVGGGSFSMLTYLQ